LTSNPPPAAPSGVTASTRSPNCTLRPVFACTPCQKASSASFVVSELHHADQGQQGGRRHHQFAAREVRDRAAERVLLDRDERPFALQAWMVQRQSTARHFRLMVAGEAIIASQALTAGASAARPAISTRPARELRSSITTRISTRSTR
jgi:hypothetical protein